MENLKYSLFDFFSYVLPTFCLLLSICSINHGLLEFDLIKLNTYLAQFDSKILVLFLPVCYLVGHIIEKLGRIIHKLIETKILDRFEKLKRQNVTKALKNSEMYILIRELTPKNFGYIQKWNVYRKMYSNILMCSLIFGLYLVLIKEMSIFSSTVILGLIVFSFIETRKYKRWNDIESVNTINLFKLNSNADEKLFQKKS